MDKSKPYNEIPLLTSIFIEETKSLQKLAEDTRVAIEVLNYGVGTFPSKELLFNIFTLFDVKKNNKIELDSINDKTNDYRKAFQIGLEIFEQKGTISLSDIEEINKPLNKKKQLIRTNLASFDSDLTRISYTDDSENNEILYTPPHGKELLQKLVIDMLDFVYDDETYVLHPLIKIALIHYQFESIYPFRDGNAETNQILNLLLLYKVGYFSHPIIYLNNFSFLNKKDYYSLLCKTKETQNYIDIIQLILKWYKASAERTLYIIERLKGLLLEYKSEEFLNGLTGQKSLLSDMIDMVFQKICIRNSDLVEKGIHRQTAAIYLDQLVDKGLLGKEKVGKHNIYKNVKLLVLFEGENKYD